MRLSEGLGHRLAERNLALVGFMTAGKTQVGRILSRRTGMPLRDIDALICEIEQMPIHEIFRHRGEPYFRAIESQILRQLCEGQGQVISCGGGTVLAPENRMQMESRCLRVWLRVSEPSVLVRLDDPTAPRRPMLEGMDTDEIVHRLFLQREPFYAESDLVIDTDGRTVEEVAQTIVVTLGLPTIDESLDPSVNS